MSPIRQRKNVEHLTADEARGLVEAFASIRPGAQNGPYWTFVEAHRVHGQHKNELFLPWHRAFIFEFEEALRATGNPDVTLPYWDFIKTPSLPGLLGELPAPRPRYTDAERLARKLLLPTGPEVDCCLQIKAFRYFGGSHCDGPTSPGRLEGLHGLVHTWVGPDMYFVPTSPEDPAFWLLHANVDRLWEIWQRDHTTKFTCPDYQLPGLAGTWMAPDVLNPLSPRLGYEYIESAISVALGRQIAVVENLTLHVPAGTAERYELQLNGLRLIGDGVSPAMLMVFAGESLIERVSLFGWDHQHQVKAGGRRRSGRKQKHDHEHSDNAHHADDAGTEVRLDVSELVRASADGKIQLRFELHGAPPNEPLKGLVMEAVAVVAI